MAFIPHFLQRYFRTHLSSEAWILEFDEELYHNRNMVETMFSVLKRRYGEEVKARKYWNQVKELKIKLIGYNLGRSAKVVYVI